MKFDLKNIANSLQKPVDASSMIVFRVFFGAIMVWEVCRYFHYGWIHRYFVKSKFLFTFPGFEWVAPWAGNEMYLHFFFMGVLAIFMMLGLMYRLSAILFFFCFTFVFLLEASNYLNHFYLICLISFLMIFLPLNRTFSLDAKLNPKIQSETIPRWALWLMQFQIGIAYFFGGIAKINSDWLQGEPMRMWLAEETDFPIIGQFFTEEWMVYAFAYGGLLLDLLIIPFLMWKRTRIFAFLGGVTFHLINSELFRIGIFPWFMLAASTIFFEPDWARRLARFLKFNVPKVELPKLNFTPPPLKFHQKAIGIGLGIYVLWQIVMPLRHFTIPGNVNWTEEGHNFSWHMKLRDKNAKATFYVTNLDSGKEYEVNPRNYLSKRQARKMAGRPHMVLQFAHFLEDLYHHKGYENIEIRAKVMASVNGRKKQLLIDPERDLTKIKDYQYPADWIVPLTQPLRLPKQKEAPVEQKELLGKNEKNNEK